MFYFNILWLFKINKGKKYTLKILNDIFIWLKVDIAMIVTHVKR